MQINIKNLVTYLNNNFIDDKKQTQVIKQTKEMLSQELRWNQGLLI